MHELHVVTDLFQDLLNHARDNQVTKITQVHLTMGDFTEINEDILRYFFESHSRGTPLEGAVLHIQKSPTRELRLLSFDCES
ncbi:MAG: hydrogenase maturation nickel metallochaperone HypA [Candidatus Omnitrophica bacterium]|nr:hydrogenase maturation nickel metallochaperone HypA [Candidatus Omnitrophota bacterium]MDD5670558.1 hydrogenase maturation nickel metallochaperone HypA [Candidatus Omnitrophota bacterium]